MLLLVARMNKTIICSEMTSTGVNYHKTIVNMYPKLILIEEANKEFIYRPGFYKNEFVVHLVEDPSISCTFVFNQLSQTFEPKRNRVGHISTFIGERLLINEYKNVI